ncbi:hypothetical protein CA13_05720 [Planctomycetes bacterium CA13]|uniref:Tll0287-like domain-containing protein n=1 Tax=Novipirellula herctigrandis TaxID=2527986 RepID=A0A5C5YVX0_9BACT|nr:hypothetical protein CA13_05720 [Planctomycetes bacterium CA13]
MKYFLPVLIFTAILGCADDSTRQGDSQPLPSSDPMTRATAAKNELQKRLSGRLKEAMSTAGPVAAISVCSKEAPQIADQVSKEQGVLIGRTSAKLRNAANKPRQWVLDGMNLDAGNGDPMTTELADGIHGVMLPIKLQATCLMCHGPTDQISDNVKSQLAKSYPDDQATGFKEGDLRGWFWVEVPGRS